MDTTEERRIAEAATPGPWFCESDGIYNATRSYMVVPTGDTDQDRADAAAIVAAHNRSLADLAVVEAEEGRHTHSHYRFTPNEKPDKHSICSCGRGDCATAAALDAWHTGGGK